VKESLRRFFVFALYLGATVRFFTWKQFEDVIEDLIDFKLGGYLVVIIIGIFLAVIHKCINWIFQKKKKAD